MKSFQVMRFLFSTLILFGALGARADQQKHSTANAREGGWTSGGGNAFKWGDGYALYDFVEAGIEDAVELPQDLPDEMGATAKLNRCMGGGVISPDIIHLVSNKLNEIYKVNPVFAVMLLDTFSAYQWSVPIPEVVTIKDLGKTPIKLGNLEVYTAAVRDDEIKRVTIYRPIFKGLPEQQQKGLPTSHQVGLLFHEDLYAVLYNQKLVEDSYQARDLNSYLFSPAFEGQGYDQLVSRLDTLKIRGDWLPYDQYQTLISPEFKNRCDSFQKSSTQTLVSTLQSFTKVASQIAQAESKYPNYGTTEPDLKPILAGITQIRIGGQQVSSPVRGLVLPAVILTFKDHGGWSPGGIFEYRTSKTLFKANEEELKSIRKYQKLVLEILEDNERTYFNRCLKPETLEVMRNFTSMDANPRKTVD